MWNFRVTELTRNPRARALEVFGYRAFRKDFKCISFYAEQRIRLPSMSPFHGLTNFSVQCYDYVSLMASQPGRHVCAKFLLFACTILRPSR